MLSTGGWIIALGVYYKGKLLSKNEQNTNTHNVDESQNQYTE